MSELINFTTYKNKSFKTIDLYIYEQETRLTAKATAYHTYIISRPKEWSIYKKDLYKKFKEKKEAVDNAIKELESIGYLYKFYSMENIKNKKDENIRGRRYKYLIFERPVNIINVCKILKYMCKKDNKKWYLHLTPVIKENMKELKKIEDSFYFNNFFQYTGNQCIENQSIEKPVAYQLESKQIVNKQLISKDIKSNIHSKECIKDSKESKNLSRNNNFKYNNKYYDLTIKCLDLLYNKILILHPKKRKNTFYSEDKINNASRLISYYINGFPKSNYFKLKEFIKDNKLSYNPDIGFSDENKFLELFKLAINIYNPEYFPDQKDNLPGNLPDFLLNNFSVYKSYFLKFGYNPPKKLKEIEEKLKIDKYPKITRDIKKLFNELEKLSIKDENTLIYNVSQIVKFVKDLNQTIEYEGKTYTRENIEGYPFQTKCTLNFIVREMLDYYQDRFSNKIVYPNNFNVNGFIFKDFIYYFEKTYDIKLKMNSITLKNKLLENLKKSD